MFLLTFVGPVREGIKVLPSISDWLVTTLFLLVLYRGLPGLYHGAAAAPALAFSGLCLSSTCARGSLPPTRLDLIKAVQTARSRFVQVKCLLLRVQCPRSLFHRILLWTSCSFGPSTPRQLWVHSWCRTRFAELTLGNSEDAFPLEAHSWWKLNLVTHSMDSVPRCSACMYCWYRNKQQPVHSHHAQCSCFCWRHSLLGAHASGRQPCHCSLGLGNPSLALSSEESTQSKMTICWWPKFVMPYFTWSIVWSVTVVWPRLISTGVLLVISQLKRSAHPCMHFS